MPPHNIQFFGCHFFGWVFLFWIPRALSAFSVMVLHFYAIYEFQFFACFFFFVLHSFLLFVSLGVGVRVVFILMLLPAVCRFDSIVYYFDCSFTTADGMMLLVLRVPVLSRDSHFFQFCFFFRVVLCLCLTKACSNSCLLLLFCLLIISVVTSLYLSLLSLSTSALMLLATLLPIVNFLVVIGIFFSSSWYSDTTANTTLVSLSNKHDSLQLTTCSA